MAFARDRDLLAIEPAVFRDVSWSGQERARGLDAVVTGTALVSASSDFEGAAVEAGQVVVVSNIVLEILARVSATELTVSLMRNTANDAPIAPGFSASAKPFEIHTFMPQVEIVHSQVMWGLGLNLGDEAKVLNPWALTLVEALGGLWMVYSAAAAMTGYSGAIAIRAEMYRERVGLERSRASVQIDTDGDGEADVVRRLNTIRFARA